MEPITPTSPTKPSFGQNTGDNALATIKNVNQVIEYINQFGTEVYADNNAALAAGKPLGYIYRTGDLLKIVH
jgi:hypothetical protein